MAIVITSNATYFRLNDTSYAKIYQPLKQGSENIGIINVNDTRQKLISVHYSEFVIDGNTYGSQSSTIEALLDVVYELNGTELVAGEAQNTTTVSFNNIYGGFINSPASPITTSTITFDLTSAKNGGVVEAYYEGNILTKDSFIGGTIISFSNGGQVANELCFIWVVYDKGNNVFFVNIKADWTGATSVTNPPLVPSLSLSEYTFGAIPPLAPSLSLSEYTI